MFKTQMILPARRLTKFVALVIALGVAAGNGIAASEELGGDDEVRNADPGVQRTLTEAPKPWPGPRYEPPYDQAPEAAQQNFVEPQGEPTPPEPGGPKVTTVGGHAPSGSKN